MPVIWRAQARNSLLSIIKYIAADNPPAARRLHATIQRAVSRLAKHPLMYRTGRVEGTREMVAHPNYIIIFRVGPTRVEIVEILHARRNYP